MNKKQFLKFSKAIADSTGVKETISAFENKKGYAGRRTLERCCQAAAGFKEGLPSKVIAERTGWSVKYVDKIRSWWVQEAATGTVIEQKPYQETPHKQEKSLIVHGLSSGATDVEFLVTNVSNNLLIVDRICVEVMHWEQYDARLTTGARIIEYKYKVKVKPNFIGEIVVPNSKFSYAKDGVDSFSISFISPPGNKYTTRINLHCSDPKTRKRFTISTAKFEIRFHKITNGGETLSTHDAITQARNTLAEAKKKK